MAMTLKPKLNQSNGKRIITTEKIKEKSKQELLAIPEVFRDPEVFRGLEKTLA